jgi:calcium/calmodulin-dependent protein kinase I
MMKYQLLKENGENVAVKIISKKKLTGDDFQSLKTEIQILSLLNHPNIIKLHETFDEGSDIYIITELVEGGELFDRIVSKTNYTEKEARDLIRVLLQTLAYLNEKGVVHRDMKPENLLLVSGQLYRLQFFLVSLFVARFR